MKVAWRSQRVLGQGVYSSTLPHVFSAGIGSIYMATAIASNALLLQRALSFRFTLNAGHFLRLFTNNFTPSPASAYADFFEAAFVGYAPINLNGMFGTPVFVRDGLYELASPTFGFTCTFGISEDIYGWWITDLTTVKLSGRFDAPVSLLAGQTLNFLVFPETWNRTTV